ncbi:hypothetical protein [Halopiger goleimassiliensis]|uniref:hypothetical protein n=1 Tax=Halopiger goleimassiliensis TaxID=1293048 RepID=UPI000677A3AF|nr:hypothetical protein [Halopiger goleimassiliensis]
MTDRQRVIVAVLWIAVAGLISITLDPTDPTSLETIARLLVVLTALLLAGVYLFNPRGILDHRPHSD